jgi:hypothetical protein
MNRREFISNVSVASMATAALPVGSLAARGESPVVSRVKNRLHAFDYRGVKLLPGIFQRPMERARALYFSVSDLAEREQRTGMFKSFYQMPERLPYRVYFDLDSPRFL